MQSNHHLQALQEVRADIAELERQLADLRAVERWHAGKVEDATPEKTEPAPARTTEGSANGKRPPEFAALNMADAAVIVLRRAGKQMSTPEIAREIMSGGYPTRNPDGIRNATFSMLNREKERFRKVGKGEWELIENKE